MHHYSPCNYSALPGDSRGFIQSHVEAEHPQTMSAMQGSVTSHIFDRQIRFSVTDQRQKAALPKELQNAGKPWERPFQVGHGLEQPQPVEGISAHGRGWDWISFKVHSKPNHSMSPDFVCEVPRHGNDQGAAANAQLGAVPELELKQVWNILPENYCQDYRAHPISSVQNELGFKK